MEREHASDSRTVMQRLEWYLTHRIEFLQSRQSALKQQLWDESPDYELLREWLENNGRLRELNYLADQITRW